MSRFILRVLRPALLVVLLPCAAFAQASISGVVRDASGAVLPGVTVEAASPALIEGVRSLTTDGTGQYRIVDLRPGTYTVTFTLPGFATVQREGIQLSGNFAASVNAELRVGGLEETITVTGESPIVDVQSVRQQRVMDKEIINAIPTSRSTGSLAILVPGVTAPSALGGAAQDVGGSRGDSMPLLSAHGSRPTDQRLNIEGLATNNDSGAGARTGFMPNMSGIEEVVIDTAAIGADVPTGGVRVNIIPKEGGNFFSGTVFFTGANESFQSDNYTQELQDRGLRTPNRLKSLYDFAPGAGGPILRNKLWFYAAARKNAANTYVGGLFDNRNEGNPAAWTYEPGAPSVYPQRFYSYSGRLTWQVNRLNKLAAFYQGDYRCQCPRMFDATAAPESAIYFIMPFQRLATVTWTSALSSRMVLEAAIGNRAERWAHAAGPFHKGLIGVTEQSLNLSYRGGVSNQSDSTSFNTVTNTRASLSYVTGSHNLKVGFDNRRAWREHLIWNNNPLNVVYRLNRGVPNQITLFANPLNSITRAPWDLGVYANDQWTIRRVTLSLGARLEHYTVSFPDMHIGPGPLVPTRNLSFEGFDWISWKDISPRVGVNVDLFGTGRTALKMSLGRYMVATGIGTGSIFGNDGNPVIRMANQTTRSWNDANRDFAPDCDLTDPAANGECGAMANRNFGKPISALVYDPDTLTGWGKRPDNWEFSVGVQHQLMRRMSLDVAYFRRSFGNLTVVDNLAVAASDFTPFSITAPADPRLPNGGGSAISNLFDLNPNKVGQVDRFLTFASNYGGQIERWNGVDMTLSLRPENGLVAQGGFSTGRTLTDDCAVRAKLPEIDPQNPYCRVAGNFLTYLKGLAAYTIPRIEMQVSATFQSTPGQEIAANYVAPNAVIAPSLGRPLSGGAANRTINLVEPGTMFGDRLYQVDFRVGKILRFADTRSSLNLDLYNAFNSSNVLRTNNAFGDWLRPQEILQGRLARVSLQFDF